MPDTTPPAGDRELFARIRTTLNASLISDALDAQGLRDQALPAHIRPLDDSVVMVGRARTGLYRDVYRVAPGTNPYALEIALVDDLGPDEVIVLACGATGRIAPWGELLSTASIARGAVGCLTDGKCRDIRPIREMGFPVFCAGIGPLDSKGRGEVTEIDVPVECGGVPVRPGDLIIGDADGVVVVPREAEEAVLGFAFAKVAGESETLGALQRGEKLVDVFERYGVL